MALYLDLLADAAGRSGVEIWSYCLMTNHAHLIAVPSDEDGLRRTFRHVHRHYTGYINARLRVTGHLWQGCFSSVAMDEPQLVHALRYVSLNPVGARLATRASDWYWSSVHAQLGQDDGITQTLPIRERFPDFAALLAADEDEAMSMRLRHAETIGRPIGDAAFLRRLEVENGRSFTPAKRGPKPREN